MRFIVAGQTLFDLETSGIVMASTKSIVTPQIGFSILGNLIEDDAGGLIITTVPGDDITFDDGKTVKFYTKSLKNVVEIEGHTFVSLP